MGFVANFVRFPAVQNFENRLRFNKATESLKVGIFETQCRKKALTTAAAMNRPYHECRWNDCRKE